MLFIRLTTPPSLLQMDAVPSPDVPMAILRHRLVDTDDLDEKMAIVDEMKLLLGVIEVFYSCTNKCLKGLFIREGCEI